MDVVIAGEDGSIIRCHEAGSSGPGVILLHPWWGLTWDITEMADRLGGEGFRVIAPDLFEGRTADTPEEAEKLVTLADPKWERLLSDAERAVGHLKAQGVQRVAAVGLSFGAAYAVLLATRGRVDAAVLYYGTAGLEEEDRLPLPVLGHFADDDPYEPDGGEAFFQVLQRVGASTEHHRYPGTYHWFAEPSNSHYQREAAEAAWVRTASFLHRTLGE